MYDTPSSIMDIPAFVTILNTNRKHWKEPTKLESGPNFDDVSSLVF